MWTKPCGTTKRRSWELDGVGAFPKAVLLDAPVSEVFGGGLVSVATSVHCQLTGF